MSWSSVAVEGQEGVVCGGVVCADAAGARRAAARIRKINKRRIWGFYRIGECAWGDLVDSLREAPGVTITVSNQHDITMDDLCSSCVCDSAMRGGNHLATLEHEFQ